MIMLNFVCFFIFVFLFLGTGLAGQGVDLQRFVQNDPSLKKQLDALNLENSAPNDTLGVPTSQPPRVLNSSDLRHEPALTWQSEGYPSQEPSVLTKYFSILTGQKLHVYGTDEFRKTQDANLLFFNTTGREYRLAPGDVLRVTLRGFLEIDQTVKIGRDGYLVLNNLSPIQVSGHTIAKIEEQLLDILRLDDASASVYLALDTARLITVQVSGNVKAPRALAVPAYTPLSRIFSYAGGISDTGSLRNVILWERNGDDGSPTSRPVSLSDVLTAGEALQIRFVETRDVSTIQVRGAVIAEYALATNKALPVKDVLKNASVLKPEALLNFAFVLGRNVVSRAIDLEHALLDPAITIPAGATLHVFEQSEYRELVSANPNDTVDPMAAAMTQAEVAEIYLNGERLAYVPPSGTRRLADAIRPFYSPTPQTILDFVLIQRVGTEGRKVEALSLRDVLAQPCGSQNARG